MRLTAVVLIATVCGAVPIQAQQKIPVRQVGPAEAVATVSIDAFSLVRPLSNGRVIVTYKKSVGVLGADLKTYTSIADSTTVTRPPPGTAYGVFAIVAGRGDTTYFVDPGAGGLIVLDANGTPGRMIALPKSSDMGAVAFTTTGTFRTYMDSKGRLWYRASRSFDGQLAGQVPAGTKLETLSPPADSFALLRADFESRAVDTIAAIRIPGNTRTITDSVNGQRRVRSIRYPFSIVDAWTVLPDGTIAIVRGTDYHVDWIHPNGSRSSTPKMPFDWRRITDEEKSQLVDSLQKIAAAANARDSVRRAASTSANNTVNIQDVAPATTMPDYFPPLREGAARSDLDGNIWILPTTSASAQGGGPLYDVVNRKGQLFERVQFPPGCALAGFLKGGVVYTICTSTGLERRRILN